MDTKVKGGETKPRTAEEFMMFLMGNWDDSRDIRGLEKNKEDKPRETEKDVLQRTIDSLPQKMKDYLYEKRMEKELKKGSPEWKAYQEKRASELLKRKREHEKTIEEWKTRNEEEARKRRGDYLEKKNKEYHNQQFNEDLRRWDELRSWERREYEKYYWRRRQGESYTT